MHQAFSDTDSMWQSATRPRFARCNRRPRA